MPPKPSPRRRPARRQVAAGTSRVMSQRTAGKVVKAVYVGFVTCLGQLSVILVDNVTLEKVTEGQWATIGLFTLTAAGGTFGLAGWTGPKVDTLIMDERER